MARGRRRVARRGTAFRPPTEWEALTNVGNTTVAGATKVIVGSFTVSGPPVTIRRTLGLLNVSSDQVAATEEYGASFGIAVVSDQAVAIGVTAVPTPVTDHGSDLWFVLEDMAGAVVFGDATGRFEVGHERVLDSKAMRKVDIGQYLVGVLETSSFQPSCDLYKSFRMLVKLH